MCMFPSMSYCKQKVLIIKVCTRMVALSQLIYFDSVQLLKFPLSHCRRYEQLQNETRQTAEYVNKTSENMVHRVLSNFFHFNNPWGSQKDGRSNSYYLVLQQFLEMVANFTGIQDVSLESVWSVYDTLFCEVSCLTSVFICLFTPSYLNFFPQQCLKLATHAYALEYRSPKVNTAILEDRTCPPNLIIGIAH